MTFIVLGRCLRGIQGKTIKSAVIKSMPVLDMLYGQIKNQTKFKKLMVVQVPLEQFSVACKTKTKVIIGWCGLWIFPK